jgi:23S rRNA-/tRNA-specific pseudouridylate synthase
LFCLKGAAIGHPIVRDTVYGYNGSAIPYGGLSYHELPSDKASIELQDAIYQAAMNTSMCVHATLIRFQHPITGIDLEFTSIPSF